MKPKPVHARRSFRFFAFQSSRHERKPRLVVAERINETYALVVRHHIYQADALQIATCRISGSSVLLSADKKLLVAAKTEGLEALDIETDEGQITNRFR
jgi:hypothetical protein